ERAAVLPQTPQTNRTLTAIRDPATGANFPGNVIPASRANAQGLALMNLLPMPNATGSGYNFVYQEASIPHPRRQHLLRLDYRPTSEDSIAAKGQTWWRKQGGHHGAGAAARRGRGG